MTVRRKNKFMNKIILAACLGCLLLAGGSCIKAKVTPSIVAGTWEIRSSQISIIPTVNYPAGNDSLLKFTNSNYSIYSKGQLVKTGTYTILTISTSPGQNAAAPLFSHQIVYDGNTGAKSYVLVSGNKMTFEEGDMEVDAGIVTVYEKLP
jgi:hypothetical protein